ncbi:MAG: hypothetical protein HFE77_03155 [Clostridiales bacterium]|nr:hypothetical protein [Clostridiales bacterium]
MANLAEVRKQQEEKQRQAIEQVLRQHADEVVAKEISSIDQNYQTMLSGYTNAQAGYTPAGQFDTLDEQRKSFLNQGDQLLKWLPLSSLSDQDKGSLTSQVQQMQSFADSGYAQKYSGSQNRLKNTSSLNQIGANLRDIYGQYKDAEEYDTFSKLKTIEDVQAFIDERKAAGTEKIVKENQRILGAATADIEIDTGKYIYQDQIDRANTLLAVKYGQKYGVGESSYADVMRKADQDYLDGILTQEDYDLLSGYAGIDATDEDHGTRLDYLKQDAASVRSKEFNAIYNEWAEIDENYYQGKYSGKETEWAEKRLAYLERQMDEMGYEDILKREKYYTEAAEQLNDSAIPQEWRARVEALDEETLAYLDTYNDSKNLKELRKNLGSKLAGKSDDYVKELAQWRKNIQSLDKAREEAMQAKEKAAEMNALELAGQTLANIGNNIAGTPAAIFEGVRGLWQGVDGDAYKAYTYNDGFKKIRNAQVSSEQLTENIRNYYTDRFGEEAGNIAAFTYGTVNSAIQNVLVVGGTTLAGAAVGSVVGGVGGGTAGAMSGAKAGAALAASKLTGVIMASTGAANELYSRLQAGESNERALTYAMASFTVESLSETYSIGEIMDAVRNRNKTGILAMLIQSAKNEGLEEVASNWGMRLFDAALDGRESELLQGIADKQESGMSLQEALSQTLGELVSEDAPAFVAGALSGMMISGGSAIVQQGASKVTGKAAGAMQNRSDAKAALRNGKGENLIETALSILPEDSKAYQIAHKYTAENAPALTKSDTRTLMKAVNEQRFAAVDEAVKTGQKNAIRQELIDQGVDQADTLTGVTYKALTGQEMTADESALFEKSEEAQAIVKELREDTNSSFAKFFYEQSEKTFSAAAEEAENLYQHVTGRGVEAIAHPLINQQGQQVVRLQEITALHEDGSMTVSVKDKKGQSAGERTITAEEISDRSGLAGAMFEAAADMNDVQAANAFIGAASTETKLRYDQMPAVFSAYYRLGQSGMAMDSEADVFEGGAALVSAMKKASPHFKQIAYDAGRKGPHKTGVSYAQGISREQVEAAYRKSLGKHAGKVIDLIDKVAKKAGTEVLFAPLAAGVDGCHITGTNKILLSLDISEGTLTRTLGHETFHYVANINPEQAALLQKEVIDWLKEKGLYEKVYKDFAKRYAGETKGLSEAKKTQYLHEEMAADACFDALSNGEFLNDFSHKADKGVLEKIKDFLTELSDMLKKAIQSYAVSHQNDTIVNELLKDQAMLDKINKRFAKLLESVEGKEYTQQDVQSGNVKYSIAYTTQNQPVVIVEEDILKGVPHSEWVRTVKNTIAGKFSQGIPVSGRLIKVNRKTQNEYTGSKYTQRTRRVLSAVYEDKFKAAGQLDEIVLASTNYINEDLKHARKDSFKEFARGDVLLRVGENDYSAKVIVGFTSNKEMVLYDVIDFMQTNLEIKKDRASTVQSQNAMDYRHETQSNNTVPQKAPSVNSNDMQKDKNDTLGKKGEVKKQRSSETQEQRQMRELVNQNETLQAQNTLLKQGLTLKKIKVPSDELLSKYMRDVLSSFRIFAKKERFAAARADLKKAYEILANIEGTSPNETIAVNTAQAYALRVASDLIKANRFYEVSDGIEIWHLGDSRRLLAADVEMEVARRLLDPVMQNFAGKQYHKLYEQRLKYEKLAHEQSAHYQQRLTQRTADKNAQIEALKEEYRQRIDKLRSAKNEKYNREQVLRRVKKCMKSIAGAMVSNSKNDHIADALKPAVQNLFMALEGSNKISRSLSEQIEEIRRALYDNEGRLTMADIDLPEGYGGMLDDLAHSLENLTGYYVESLEQGENALNLMSAEQLKQLDMVLQVIRKAAKGYDNALNAARYRHIDDARKDTKNTLARLEKRSGKRRNAADTFLNVDNLTPVYFFERLGEGGRAIFEELTAGADKLAMHTREILDFTEEVMKGKERAVKSWNQDEHWIDISSGKHVQMTTAQIMSLYALSKRESAKGHLYDPLNGGIRTQKYKKNGQLGGTMERVSLREADVKKIIGTLTAEQKAMADALQEYMSKVGARWGNEISMQRWGIHFFMEENYFPMTVDKGSLETTEEVFISESNHSNLYGLLNRSFNNKITKGANNALVISNIFDVFADHMYQMAAQNALGPAVLNANRWWERVDYTAEGKKIDDSSVKRQVETFLGKEMTGYFGNLMSDLNGNSGDLGAKSLTGKFLSTAKATKVAGNLKVAVLQPLSYVRAAYVINPKYLAAAMTDKQSFKKNSDMMGKSGIANWKSFGFYDASVSRNIQDLISGQETLREKLVNGSMALAEKADEWTWRRLWAAVGLEAEDQGFIRGTEEFNEAVNRRFDEVVYKTQVVDSVLTRSQLMRSKRDSVKMMTAYMSEAAVSYNVAHDALVKVHDAQQAGVGVKEAWANAGTALAVMFVSYALETLTDALAGGWRDERDKDFLTKMEEQIPQALLDDMPLLSEIPYIADLWSVACDLIQGKSIGEAASAKINDMTAISEMLTGIQTVMSAFQGESEPYKAIYDMLTGISSLTGVPFANATREVIALWNNAVSWMGHDDLKVRKYEETMAARVAEIDTKHMSSDEAVEYIKELASQFDIDSVKAKVSEFYKDKYQKAEERERQALSNELLQTGLWSQAELAKKTDNWLFKKEHPKEEFSQTKELYEAFATGKGIPQAMDRYKRYTDETGDAAERYVRDEAKEQCKKAYLAGDIDDQTALSYIRKYFVVKSPAGTLADWKKAKNEK